MENLNRPSTNIGAMPMPKVQVKLYLEEDLAQKIESEALKRGMARTDLIIEILTKALYSQPQTESISQAIDSTSEPIDLSSPPPIPCKNYVWNAKKQVVLCYSPTKAKRLDKKPPVELPYFSCKSCFDFVQTLKENEEKAKEEANEEIADSILDPLHRIVSENLAPWYLFHCHTKDKLQSLPDCDRCSEKIKCDQIADIVTMLYPKVKDGQYKNAKLE
jgi:hypothetical protein